MTSSSLLPKKHLHSSLRSSSRRSRNLFHPSDECFSHSILRYSLQPKGANCLIRSYCASQRWSKSLTTRCVDLTCFSDSIKRLSMAARRDMTTNSNISKQRRHRRARAIKNGSSSPTTKDRIRNPSLNRGTVSSSELRIMGNKPSLTSSRVLAERLETRLNWARQGLENILGIQQGSETRNQSASDGHNTTGDKQSSVRLRPQQRKGLVMDANWWIWNILLAATPAALIALLCEFYAKPIALAEQERRFQLQELMDNGTSVDSRLHQHSRRSDPHKFSRNYRMKRENCPDADSSVPSYRQQFQLFQLALAQNLLGSEEENEIQHSETMTPIVPSNDQTSRDKVTKQSNQSGTVTKTADRTYPADSTKDAARESLHRQDKDMQLSHLDELKELRCRLQALEQEMKNHRPLLRNEQPADRTISVARSALTEDQGKCCALPRPLQNEQGSVSTETTGTDVTGAKWLGQIIKWISGADKGRNIDKNEAEHTSSQPSLPSSAPLRATATQTSSIVEDGNTEIDAAGSAK